MAAAYGYHLCNNHPFIDGNKRIAFVAMDTFLQKNSLEITASEFINQEVFLFRNLLIGKCQITSLYCQSLSDLDSSYLSLMDLGEATPGAELAILCYMKLARYLILTLQVF
jgi:prophage maintenance system killer protein